MSAYSDKVLADGAVAYWRLNETSGTTANSLVGSYPGTISGGVTLGQAGALADGDKAMAFDGATGYIQSATGPSLTTAVTLEAWVTLGIAPAGSGLRGIVVKGQQGVAFDYGLIANNGAIGYRMTAGDRLTASANLLQGAWVHCVAVVEETTPSLSIYLNGVLWAGGFSGTALPADCVTSSATPVQIGHSAAAAAQYFPGQIDDVAIYPTALTARQIADHYAAASLPAPGSAPYAPVVLPSAKPPHGQWLPITPSDIVDSPFSALWVGGAGTVAAVGLDGRVVNFTGIQAGTRLRISGRRVNDTATTATAILALGRP